MLEASLSRFRNTRCLPNRQLPKFFAGLFRADYFWHMTCIICFVAKKYHSQVASQGAFQSAADPVAMNIRMSMFPIPRLGPPPRPKKIREPRRRLLVSGFAEPAQTVKIIHADQNLDTRMVKVQIACESRA